MYLKASTLSGCAVIALMIGAASASDVPHLYSATHEINKDVDSARHVERAVTSNTFAGEWKIEFMAIRTDLVDTSERWTVFIERGEEPTDLGRYVYIDGILHHASFVSTTDGQPFYTISDGNQSETIALNGSASQSEIAEVAAIINATQEYTDVVRAVFAEIVQGLETDSGCGTYESCVGDCQDEYPSWDQTCEGDPLQDEVVQCLQKYTCCLEKAEYVRCVRYCWCDFCDTEHEDPRDCYEESDQYYYLIASSCFDDLADCIGLSIQ